MSIRPHTFFYYLLILMARLIQPVKSQDILMASGGMVNNPIVSGELGGMQAGLSGAFFGFVVEKAAAEASADVTFQFQGTRAWFSLADLFRTTEQEQNLMEGILQLEVDTQSQTLTGSVITPEPSATMPGVIIYPSKLVPDDPPATSDISLVNQSPILSRINSAILNLIKTVLQSGESTDTAEVQCRTRYTASNTPISEPTSTPDPAAVLKEDERICDVFDNDPFPESFGLYSTDEKNGDLTVEFHSTTGDVLITSPSSTRSTRSTGFQIATLKYQPRQAPEGSTSHAESTTDSVTTSASTEAELSDWDEAELSDWDEAELSDWDEAELSGWDEAELSGWDEAGLSGWNEPGLSSWNEPGLSSWNEPVSTNLLSSPSLSQGGEIISLRMEEVLTIMPSLTLTNTDKYLTDNSAMSFPENSNLPPEKEDSVQYLDYTDGNQRLDGIYKAILKGDLEYLMSLKADGINILQLYCREEAGLYAIETTALSQAIEERKTKIVEFLLKSGGPANGTGKKTYKDYEEISSESYLEQAISSGSLEILILLLGYGADPDQCFVSNRGFKIDYVSALSRCNVRQKLVLLSYGAKLQPQPHPCSDPIYESTIQNDHLATMVYQFWIRLKDKLQKITSVEDLNSVMMGFPWLQVHLAAAIYEYGLNTKKLPSELQSLFCLNEREQEEGEEGEKGEEARENKDSHKLKKTIVLKIQRHF